jgi:hypothetical protein
MIIFSLDAAIVRSLSGEAILRLRAFGSEQALGEIDEYRLPAAFVGWVPPTAGGWVHLGR